jgi:hypothetical protein
MRAAGAWIVTLELFQFKILKARSGRSAEVYASVILEHGE